MSEKPVESVPAEPERRVVHASTPSEKPVKRVPVSPEMIMFAVAGSLLIIAAGCGLAWATDGSWSDAAGWVEALATVSAFGAAILAAVLVGRTLDLELEREDKRLDADRSGQAALVAGWPDNLIMLRQKVKEASSAWETEEWVDVGVHGCWVFVRNASAVPVTEVDVRIAISLMDRASHGEKFHTIYARHSEQYLPPSDSPARWPVTSRQFTMVPDLDTEPLSPREYWVLVDFRFTDAAGIKWHRGPTGFHQRTSDCALNNCDAALPR